MNKREFLMLAHNYNDKKHGIGGWFLSEKLDGQRCFWDGGVTQGMFKSQVPWANTAKDHIRVAPPLATGLWSRYGNPIYAPKWWRDRLPRIMLDGELYIGRHQRQELMSTVRTLTPDDIAWEDVEYHIFDLPVASAFTQTGRINNPNFVEKIMDRDQLISWLLDQDFEWEMYWMAPLPFRSVVKLMDKHLVGNTVLQVVRQDQLPFMTGEAQILARLQLEQITESGGEGVMLRSPDQVWEPKRVNGLVKMKKLQDAEARVIDYVSGRQTDKGSKLLGLMGALVVEYKGKQFELSGFTDTERELLDPDGWCTDNPGCLLPESINSEHFPRGSIVTFRFREHSKDGIPIEARYWRTADAQA